MTQPNIIFAGLFDNPATVWIWIIIVPVVGGLGLGLISALLAHQKSMAQIMRGQADDDTKSEIAALRKEVYELKGMLHQALQSGSTSARVAPAELEPPTLRVTSGE
jgi:hypothetical protein